VRRPWQRGAASALFDGKSLATKAEEEKWHSNHHASFKRSLCFAVGSSTISLAIGKKTACRAELEQPFNGSGASPRDRSARDEQAVQAG
jgi:hypothetical protein